MGNGFEPIYVHLTSSGIVVLKKIILKISLLCIAGHILYPYHRPTLVQKSRLNRHETSLDLNLLYPRVLSVKFG